MNIRENTPYKRWHHVGDLIINVLLRFAVICLPLTVGAVVREIWSRYCITNHLRHRCLDEIRSYRHYLRRNPQNG